jgi:Ser-tRNA(Ala) deacylase AlaX
MTNIFNQHPDLTVHPTSIRAMKSESVHRTAIAFGQNIFRPAGGGQPHDLGTVTIGDEAVNVVNVTKQDGDTWVIVDRACMGSVEIGDMALLEVDAPRRAALSRSHSLTHLMMAAARHVLADFDSKGASIGYDGFTVSVRLRTSSTVTDELMSSIDCLTRHFVLRDAPVSIGSSKSVDDAAGRFRHWRVDSDLNLIGKIRIVDIAGIDANPCSGSHAKSTGEIGPFEFTKWMQSKDMEVQISARRTPTWMYWFGDGYLQSSSHVDLSAFAD